MLTSPMRVLDCELSPAIVVEPTTSLFAMARIAALHEVSHAAVLDRGRLVGIVSTRNLGAAQPSAVTSLTVGEIGGRLSRIRVAEVMTRDPPVISSTMPLAEAARLMRDGRVDAAVVCDGERVLGLLTERDLLKALDRLVTHDTSAE